MSDDEVIKFEITDYDLENEFTIKHRKGLSKYQQIYGIWADENDKEEDERPSYNNQRKQPKGYTAPIGFVAGGVQQAGKKKEQDLKKEEKESDDDEPTISFENCDSSSEFEDESSHRRGFGSLASGSLKTKGAKFGQTKSTVTEITGDIAGLRKSGPKVNTSLMREGVGHWEKHTKGIGAKLLLQMGYEPGKGLGKELQGIAAPVEAHLRKGRGAIGAYGPEKQACVPKLKEKSPKEVQDDKKKPKESKWKKSDLSKRKTRYYYRSVDDIIEKGNRPGAYRNTTVSGELTRVKVIDMTGARQRVLSGYHALSGLKAPPGVEHFEDVFHKKCSNFALPELQYNLNSLVDICEQDIISIDRTSRNHENRLLALEQDKYEWQEMLKREDKLLQDLEDVLKVVERLLDPAQEYSLSQVAQIFIDLQDKHYEEYCRYEVGELAPGLVGPLLTSAMANWNPLTQPDQHLDIWKRWHDILETGVSPQSTQIQPYHSLVWHTLIPVLRTTINNWKPRDCDPLISLIETWKDLLPQWILEHICDQLIIPRILTEVNFWNPLTDTLPVHVWIHPWIPLLDLRLKNHIYPVIQDKLGIALTNWHPSDRSAKFMLKPWQKALPDGTFIAFLVKHIVPKLQLCMQNFVINPHQQPLDGWEWVMDWADMMSVESLTLILNKYFFPRWLQTLAVWLNHNPDYVQVTDWYQGWKKMLSPELLVQTTIREHFHKALELMNRSISNQPGAQESLLYLASLGGSAPLPPQKPIKTETIAEARIASQIPSGFKELVERRCEDRGLLFVPVPHKFHEARQIYKIGGMGLHCYFDRNVLFYSKTGSTWLPTSVDKLVDMVNVNSCN